MTETESEVLAAVREAAGALNCGNRDCFFADGKNVGGMRAGTVCLCLGDIQPPARRALLRALRLSIPSKDRK